MTDRASAAERTTRPAGSPYVLRRQCACGNHSSGGTCDACSDKKRKLQTKLAVGSTDSPQEAEADRVADQIMSAPAHSPVRPAAPRIQRHADSADEGGQTAPPSVDHTLQSSGSPLSPPVRRDMERSFGTDFSAVRIHSDGAAAESARDVGAHAYTVGRDVVFGSGRYAPETSHGRRLLAHELTHVVQQSGGEGYSGAGASTLRRAPDPYTTMSIAELEKRARDPAAALELRKRFEAMTPTELQRYTANPMAQSELAKRKVPYKGAAGQGNFSSPEMLDKLKQDISTQRATGPKRSAASPVQPGIETEGGTMGAARTNIPGLDQTAIIGKSPAAGGKVNPDSEFKPQTDYKELPQTHGHAEQSIADQIAAKLKSVPREALQGRKVWILIEQEPCSTCAQGVKNPATARGVLQKLAEMFPELEFEVKNLDSSELLSVKARAAAAPGTPPVPPATGMKSSAAGPPSINKAPPEVTGEVPKTPAPKAPPAVVEPPAPKLPSALAEGAAPKVPKLPPAAAEPAVPKVPGALAEGAGPKVPALPVPEGMGGTVPRVGAGGGRFAAGAARAGAVALEGALGIALALSMLVAQLIIELIIVPKLMEWRRKLEAGRQKYLQDKIQKSFEQYQAPAITRRVRSCYLQEIRKLEAAGKSAYVTVTLLVRLRDTSGNHGLLEKLKVKDDQLPETLFDLELYDTSFKQVLLNEKPVVARTGALARCDDCSLTGDDTAIGDQPLWEQELTFSFQAPSSAALTREYPETPGEKPSCCFIATACFGSPLAPEVETLRRFRDRRLLPHRSGQAFVDFYYRTSPPIASWLERNDIARAVVREGLIRPIVLLVRVSHADE